MKRKTVFVDKRIPAEAVGELIKRGFAVVTLPPFSRLQDAVASHTDMLLFKIGDTVFSHADYVSEAPYVFEELYDAGIGKISLIDCEVTKAYPNDAVLNILAFGKKIFCKCDTVSKTVIEALQKAEYKIINVRQGYPACTVLKLNDGAALTADAGMARVLESEGIKVTVIENGGIDLYPYEYGFIGGAAGVADGKVYFTGSLDAHPSKKAIEKAIYEEMLTPIYLTRTRPIDVGGLLFTD